MIDALMLLVFPLLMALAASFDLTTMRIPNALVLAVAGAFIVVALVLQFPLATIGTHLLVSAGVLALGFGFFSVGWLGGGDVKLAAATAMWLGLGLVLPYLVYASLLGGALTLLLLALRRWPLPVTLVRIGWIDRLHDSKTGVPYGIALAASALLVYSHSVVFKALAG